LGIDILYNYINILLNKFIKLKNKAMRIKLILLVTSFLLISTTVYSQPSSPILSEPPDISLVNNSNIQLKWNAVEGATYYGVKISSNQDLSEAIFFDQVLVNFVDIGNLTPNKTYYWVVYASNSSGTSDPSVLFSFNTTGNPSTDLNFIDNTVQNLVANQELNPILGNLLSNRLEQAGHKIEQSKWTQAIHKLELFNTFVQVYKYANFISENNATLLTTDANSLISSLNNFNSPILEEKPVTDKYILKQNFPNPFNPYTFIQYSIPKANDVTLKVYDMTGREVVELVNKYQNAGDYMVQFNGNNLGSGVYIYKLICGNIVETKKMILVK
jgi:hypothetical protein